MLKAISKDKYYTDSTYITFVKQIIMNMENTLMIAEFQRWNGGEDMVIKRQHRKSCDDGVVKNL